MLSGPAKIPTDLSPINAEMGVHKALDNIVPARVLRGIPWGDLSNHLDVQGLRQESLVISNRQEMALTCNIGRR